MAAAPACHAAAALAPCPWAHAVPAAPAQCASNPPGTLWEPLQVHSDKHLTFEDCWEDWTLWGPAYNWAPPLHGAIAMPPPSARARPMEAACHGSRCLRLPTWLVSPLTPPGGAARPQGAA